MQSAEKKKSNIIKQWEKKHSEDKQQQQQQQQHSKKQYTTSSHVVEVTTQTIRAHKEVKAYYAVDHIRVEHRTQEVNNHKPTTIHKSNVTSAATKLLIVVPSKRGPFAKVCRSTIVNCLEERNDEQQEEI